MVRKLMRNLELERRKRGWSQMDVSISSGVDASYICKAERYGIAYAAHLEKLAEALDWDKDPQSLLEVV